MFGFTLKRNIKKNSYMKKLFLIKKNGMKQSQKQLNVKSKANSGQMI